MKRAEIEEVLTQLHDYRDRLEVLLLEPVLRGLKWELIDIEDEISMWESFGSHSSSTKAIEK